MTQAGRLQSAKTWLPKYEGENIVKGYKKHYGVDALCAVTELELLGVELDPEHVKNVKVEHQRRSQRPKKPKRPKGAAAQEPEIESDDYFAHIVGHTSGGAAYGVTWEEWEGTEARSRETTEPDKRRAGRER